MTMSLLAIAVPAALAAAGSLGVAWALQHRAARRVKQQDAINANLLADLAKQRSWSVSLTFTVAGLLMQCVALATGPLVLVQSVLVTTLAVAVLCSQALHRQRPDWMVSLGAVLCVGGMIAFLVIARPGDGSGTSTRHTVVTSAVTVLVLLAACVVAAVRGSGRVRTLCLAAAASMLYGVTAGLAKLATQTAQHGMLALLAEWPVYLIVVCGPLGFVLTQNAFHTGVTLPPALAVLTVGEPLTALVVGMLWLGETVRMGALSVLGEVITLSVLVAGVVLLSYRAPSGSHQPAAA
ncbi:MAG TPA: DMT family transporter [Pseudonocardiaceae bacterium]|nr:DMT family transporter [Pseudonocardiaceae bacterium]